MTQLCWQCGALPKPTTTSESPETEPLHNFHHLIISNNVPLDSEIPLIRGTISEGQNQVDTLNSQIDNLGAAITRLTQKRDKIAKNIRQHCAILSPVRRVPPELVCEILVLSLFSDDHEDSTNNPPWHLGHICRLWRYYVSTYPALWSSITIPSSSSSSDPHPLISMIETQLIRSADTPLRVCWSLHPDRRTADPGSVDLILAQSSRWKSLLLDIGYNYDGELHWLRAANGRLVALETFEVRGSYQGEIPDIFSTTPNLRNVFLSNWVFKASSAPAIPWAQITRYSGALDMDLQLEILEAAPNLLSCAISLTAWADYDRGMPAVLPRLRHLHIEMPGFLHRLEAPLLEELVCQYGRTTRGRSEILPFIQRSSCSLKTLVLRRCSIDSNLVALLQSLPSLTNLVLDNRHEHGNVNPTPTQIALLDALRGGLCPNLTSLAYRVGPKDDASHLFAMARSRFRLEPQSPRLAQLRLFGGWAYDVERCPPHIAVEIQMMCDEGFDVCFVGPHEADLLRGRGAFP